MKKISLLLTYLLILALMPANAQLAGNWKDVGPVVFPINVSGQIHGIGRATQLKFHPTNSQIMYATTATGGLYISTDGGNNWNTTGTDNLSRNNCASICIDYTNDQILYLGTGDPNYYSTYSGILKSTNGGTTWSASNNGIGNRMAIEILMSPSDHNVLIAATNDGIWKSTDGGANWSVKKSGGDFTEMRFKPGDANTMYAATHTQFFRSTDMGNTWTLISLPGSGFQNGGRIGVSKADPNVVYVTFVGDFNSGTSTPVLKSTDSGASFSVVRAAGQPNLNGYSGTEGGQGNYNYAITVDPNNANTVYIVGHVVWKSTNGGAAWSQLTNWYEKVHTDMHQVVISPYDNTKIYDINDGGIWLSTDGGNNWTPKSNGLACTEIYRAAQSPARKDLIDIGTQDNGELHYINNTWYTNGGGDFGGHMVFDYQNTQDVYHLNDRSRKRLSGSGGAPSFALPFTDSDGNGNNTEMDFNSIQTNTAFASYQDVYRTTNLSSAPPTWTKISSIATQIKSLVSSPADMNILYAVTNNNRVWRSDNALAASPTFTNLAAPGSTNVRASIAPIKSNSNVVYISCGSKVYRSADKGATWADVSSGLPNVNIIEIVHDKFSTDESVYVGMATGVYYKNNTMSSWLNFSKGLPTIANINELMLFNDGTANSEIRVGYYGRGVWGSSLFNNANSFVTISSPIDGDIVSPGSNLTITASVTPGTGKTITKVEFYNGTSLLGTATASPYKVTWNSVPAGQYALTAKAYESSGTVVTSTVVNINVSPIGATFFQDCDYGGYSVGLVAGNYTLSQLQALGINNDDISSVKVVSGYQIILYADDNFQGTTVTLTSDNSCLVGNSFNDNASSIKVVQLNNSPTISITAPANNATFTAPAAINITASATDSDGSISKVEFYNGSTLLSTSTASPYSYNWTNVAAGTYTITAKAYDNGGATASASVSVKVNAPNQAPTVSITSPANNATFIAPATINITATASDQDGSIAKVEFYNGSTLLSTSTASPYSYGWTNVAAGSYSITAKAYDNNGATASASVNVTVNANAIPTVSLTSPANGSTYTAPATISIAANATDSDGSIAKVEFYNGSTLLSTSTASPYSYSWTNVAAGTYSITAKAYDNLGATATSAAAAITVIAPAGNATVYQDCNFGGYAVNLNAGSYTLAQLTALGIKDNDISSAKVQSGYQIICYADDNFQGTSLVITADNSCFVANSFNDVATSIKVSLISSNTPPTVSITSPSNNATFTAPATISIAANASDSDGNVAKVEFYNGSTLLSTSTASPYSYSWTSVAAANYTITAKAYDNLGATSSASVAVIVNAPNQNPTVSITSPANNATFTSPATIAIAATAADSDGSIAKVEFYNGSTLLSTSTASPYSYNWTGVAAGNYTITAKAYDNLGATASASVTVKVNAPNQAPTVSITSPANNATFTAPASINIAANASDSDGSIAKVEFYNGSSLLSTSTASPYSYNWTNVAAGNYTITAKAYDNVGATASASVSVKVNAPNQAPSVSITSPANNASFNAPASISITANASDSDGSIAKVEFYNGSTLLSTSTTSPYSYTWSNVAAGTYTITAKGYDNAGATATASVTVTVKSSNVCANVPQYVENNGYKDGSLVQNAGSQYKCKPWPYSGWCNGAAWAYGPGTGMYWTDAWDLVGPCSSPSASAPTMNKPTLSSTPNPFDGQTSVSFEVEQAGTVSVEVYNSQGAKVVEVFNGQLNAGSHTFDINSPKITDGVYFCKIQTGSKTETINLIKVSRPRSMK